MSRLCSSDTRVAWRRLIWVVDFEAMMSMRIRKILVPLSGSANDILCLSMGLTLGKAIKAHVEACFVRPDPETAIPYLGIDDSGTEEIREEYRRYAQQTGKRSAAKSRRHFNSACKRLEVSKVSQPQEPGSASACWREVVGRAAHEVPAAAKLNDLAVFAGPLTDYHRLAPWLLERTLLESGRPLLFSPDGTLEASSSCVAIAWDGSVSATRAVGAALPFLKSTERIEIFSVEETFEAVTDPGTMVDYLAWHGINSRGHAVASEENHNVAETLLTAAQDVGADLLVMGGYAHSRFEEVVFGGTTLHAIRNTNLPIFMMH
jgi:nucleotide-binding universal stress UspA family protein